jgi:DNA polymerase-3 subunit beta
VRFQLPGLTFTSKLIEGRFPEYRRVIPEKGDRPLHVDRQAFRQALRRTAILSNRKTNGVRLSLKEDVIEVSAENPDQEAAAEEVGVDYGGSAVEIAFNVQYILDAVESIPTDTVEIHLWDSQSSGLVVPPGDDSLRYVIMPMRL